MRHACHRCERCVSRRGKREAFRGEVSGILGRLAGVPSEFRAINYVCHPDGPPAVFSNERATTAAAAACRVSARLINSLHGARESFLLLFLFLFNAARGKKYGECARRKSLI